VLIAENCLCGVCVLVGMIFDSTLTSINKDE
jgi:hypothetical protein